MVAESRTGLHEGIKRAAAQIIDGMKQPDVEPTPVVEECFHASRSDEK